MPKKYKDRMDDWANQSIKERWHAYAEENHSGIIQRVDCGHDGEKFPEKNQMFQKIYGFTYETG